MLQKCVAVPPRQHSALAGRRSLLHYIINQVLLFFLLQSSGESYSRDTTRLKVTEGTIGLGGRKYKKFCLRVRMGGGAIVLIMTP